MRDAHLYAMCDEVSGTCFTPLVFFLHLCESSLYEFVSPWSTYPSTESYTDIRN